MKTHRVAGGGGVQLHVVETGNPKAGPFCSSTAFRSVRWPGAGSWTPSWRVTIVSSRWICEGMVCRTSRATPTATPALGR